MQPEKKEKSFMPWIIGVSILIPALVGFMYMGPIWKPEGMDFRWIPQFNAVINMLTALMLLMGVMAIKNEIVFLHKRFMTVAIVLSVVFLLFYVLYHSTTGHSVYQGTGVVKYIYLFVLVTHIVLSVAIVPLVLITYVRALSKRFDKHKKIARITFPIWMYVAISGVIVYLMGPYS